MHYTDERTHANRMPTPAKDALYDMLLNNRPSAKKLARDLLAWASEDDLQEFIISHKLEQFIVSSDEVLV